MTADPERCCVRCGGYCTSDFDGDYSCLSCGWAGFPTLEALRLEPPEDRKRRKGPTLDFSRRKDLQGKAIA